MKNVKNWLLTTVTGEKLSPFWFFFNLFASALMVVALLSVIFS